MEAFQKISEEALTECPTCHKNTLSKLISSTSFQLKGTGWYATDFRDKGKPKSAEKTEGAKDSTSGEDNSSKSTNSSDSDK